MRNVINLLGPRKVVLVVADRMVSFGLALLKEYPHMVTGVCFVTPQIQQDRDPLVIRKYAEFRRFVKNINNYLFVKKFFSISRMDG